MMVVMVAVIAMVAVMIVVVMLPAACLIGGTGVVMVPAARVGDGRSAVVGGGGTAAQSCQCPRQETAEHPTPRAARHHDSRKLIEAFPFHDPSPRHDAEPVSAANTQDARQRR